MTRSPHDAHARLVYSEANFRGLVVALAGIRAALDREDADPALKIEIVRKFVEASIGRASPRNIKAGQ